MRLPHPIERPYTPTFMRLRERTSAIIERMEEESGRPLPPKDRFFVTQEWLEYETGAIVVRVDWDAPGLLLRWAAEGDPIRPDPASPEYRVGLSALKEAAQASADPRGFFDSYAAYVVYVAQSYLDEFYRDGPTDDIPYPRQVLYVQGLEGCPDAFWIGEAIFAYDDSKQPRR
jgi:hypothetical protein